MKASKGGKPTEVRVAAVQVLALLAFVGGNNPAMTVEIMQTLEGLRSAGEDPFQRSSQE